MYVHGNQLTQTTDDDDDVRRRHTLNLYYYLTPSKINWGYLTWSLSHLQLWFRFLFVRKRFHNPSPTRRPIAKSWRNSLTHLVHRNHLISTTSPSYLFILIASPACELIPSTSLISTIIPVISRDSNLIPTAYLGSHPYLIVGLNPALIPNASSWFSD